MSSVRARARWAILADFLKEKSFQDYLGFWLGNITEQVFLCLTEFCQWLVFQSVGWNSMALIVPWRFWHFIITGNFSKSVSREQKWSWWVSELLLKHNVSTVSDKCYEAPGSKRCSSSFHRVACQWQWLSSKGGLWVLRVMLVVLGECFLSKLDLTRCACF